MKAELSAAELADESATTSDRVAWVERIGILRPSEPGRYVAGDIFRVRMISALLDAGFTEDEVAWAATEGALDLGHLDVYPLAEPSASSTRPFESFAASAGTDADSLVELYRLLGLPEPEPGDPLLRTEEAMFSDLLRVWSLARDDDAAGRAARLIGDGTKLATVGWSDLFGDQVAAEARDRYLRGEIETFPGEVVDAAATMMRLLPEMMAWLVRRYTQQAVVAGIVENFESILALRGVPREPRRHSQPAVVFADLSGFTELTERRGDAAAVHSAAFLRGRAEAVSRARGGRLVKFLGDGVMLSFPEPTAALDAALDLTGAFAGDGHGQPVHAGVHTGPVVERDRDIFGRTVNLASRIADLAGPDEVVVSDAVAGAVDAERFTFEPVPPAELKGVAEPVSLFRARTRRAS